jgi:hypothetical protein
LRRRRIVIPAACADCESDQDDDGLGRPTPIAPDVPRARTVPRRHRERRRDVRLRRRVRSVERSHRARRKDL